MISTSRVVDARQKGRDHSHQEHDNDDDELDVGDHHAFLRERERFRARYCSSSRQNHPCCQGCISLLGVVAIVLGSMVVTLRAVALAILGRQGTPIQQADACFFLVVLVHFLHAEDVLPDLLSLVDLLGRVVEELLLLVLVFLFHLLAGHILRVVAQTMNSSTKLHGQLGLGCRLGDSVCQLLMRVAPSHHATCSLKSLGRDLDLDCRSFLGQLHARCR